ncbi:flavodoxin family protein [Aminipila sp.]|uniref:flavodoxin family protein n=1 Tax=Aminipila sp. TaxID=2060095 RepID=UPI000EC1AFAF|nr:flavodoxin family protein [Aminipila sp.]HCX62930.1 flavodoxin [Clostridiales bacterium]
MSKKVSIVFHSVCGNSYIMAKEFFDEFTKHNAEVQILRVNDPNYSELAKQFNIAGQYKDKILKIEEAQAGKLLDSDIIIFGSPTYYGNVSGAMKSFMDSFSPYWTDAKFWGKKTFAYTTAGNAEGGGDMCLNAINIFAQHMGMIPVPVPADLLTGQNFPAYGLIHYVGDYSNLRPSREVVLAIKEMTERLLQL